MVQQEKNLEASRSIDHLLRDDNFNAIAQTPDHKYQTWYAVVLSSFALIVGGETVEYAHASYAAGMSDVRIVVFTTHLVLVADANTEADEVPVAQVVPRRTLSLIRLSASARIDAKEARSHKWPGALNLQLTYPDLPKPIEIVAEGADGPATQKPTPVVLLIEGLAADLAARS